jgi:cytochrome c oxidase cbb3-type subunit 1
LKTEWYSRRLCEWHFWLASMGILVMAGDLILAGLFQGAFWAAMYPWQASIDVLFPFWVVRVWAGIAMFSGVIVFIWNIYKTWQKAHAVAPAIVPA